MKKLGIVGHFGGDKEFYDGQTIKTKNLKQIVEKYGAYKTYCVDTYLVKKHKFRLLLKSLNCLFKCKKIIILLSENGMNFYLPFLNFFNKIFRRKIYHYVIGSELLDMVEENPKLVKYLNSLTQNWFEYQSGVDKLESKGVNNVICLPNCKDLQPIEKDQASKYKWGETYKFCTFSRVMEEKGITDAISAVTEINRDNKKIVATLDVYGVIDENYKEKFERLLKEYAGEVEYKGIVDSSKSVQTIVKYFSLLFPTKWKGEGFPGTILDAFASGVPVIASDWNANKELVEDGYTGKIYPKDDCACLKDCIEWAIQNEDKMLDMRLHCVEKFDEYTVEKISARIISILCDGGNKK